MSDRIVSRPSSDAYRENWERIWKGVDLAQSPSVTVRTLIDTETGEVWPLRDPADTDEPPADERDE